MTNKQPGKEQLFDHSFWRYSAEWPRDPVGYVFLARAFDEIGRALHSEQWNGDWLVKEPDEPEEPADDGDDSEWEAYERACDQAEAEFTERQANVAEMRAALARTIAEQCEREILVTAARPKPGGQMKKLEKYLWNVEDLQTRFFGCDMSLERPFADHDVSPNDCWIYITRESLDQYTGSVRGNAACIGAQSNVTKHSRAYRRAAVKEAVNAIYGGLPGAGVPEGRRTSAINAWLQKHGRSTVTEATIRRALKEMRDAECT